MNESPAGTPAAAQALMGHSESSSDRFLIGNSSPPKHLRLATASTIPPPAPRFPICPLAVVTGGCSVGSPNTSRIAFASCRSHSCVPSPWAWMCQMDFGSASPSAAFRTLTNACFRNSPSGDFPTALLPKPTTSARMFAPRS